MSTPEPQRQSDGEILVDILVGLRIDRIRAFMDRVELPRSGTKADLRERLAEALSRGIFSINDLVDYLDEVEPWGRQHVILIDAERSASAGLRNEGDVRERLEQADLLHLLEGRHREVLPETLTLSAIRLRDGVIEVVGVERREYDVREPEYDRVESSVDGETVLLKAYRHVVTRGLITLRWDTASGAAAIHISEGFGRYDYDGAASELGALVAGFIDFARFERRQIGRAIRALHDAERGDAPEVRSHRVGYQSRGGRMVEATSPSPSISVVGERAVDDAMTEVAGVSEGRIGNFFWLPRRGPNPESNPLVDDRGLHVVVIAPASRVHFMVPSEEESIAYVLQRIRALS